MLIEELLDENRATSAIQQHGLEPITSKGEITNEDDLRFLHRRQVLMASKSKSRCQVSVRQKQSGS